MALFPLPVKAEMSDRLRMPARVLQFGDGYEQPGLDGLNRQQATWDIEVIIASAAQDALFDSFLQLHGQHKSFTWQSPRDTSPQLYRIAGDVSSNRRNGGGSKPVFFSRRMQFKSTSSQSIVTPVTPSLLRLTFSNFPIIDTSGNLVAVFNSGNVAVTGGKATFNTGYLRINKSAINISPLSTYTLELLYTPINNNFEVLCATYNYPFQLGHLIFGQNSIGGDASLATFNPILNQLNHVAITRSNGVFETWLNGALVNTTTRANFDQGGDFFIGSSPGDNNIGGSIYTGSMSGLKLSNSVLYSANFTPPVHL
jgi:phage-related protein